MPAHRAFAQEVPPPGNESYTLAQLVDLAVRNTGLLGSQDARIEETRLSARQARAWPGPDFEFLAGRKNEAGSDGPGYELALAQPLPLAGKPGLRGGLLDLESEARRLRRSASETLIALDVVRLAYEYAAGRRKAAYVGDRQKRFDLVREYLSGRPFETPQRRAESGIVQNRLRILAAEAVRSQAGFKSSFEKLKTYIPLAPGSYPGVEVPWLSGAKGLDERAWLARALEKEPGLRAQRLAVAGAELEGRLARKEALPEPALSVSYERARAGETEKNYALGLSLAFPFWNGNRSGILSAERKKLAEERLLAFEEQKLKAEFTRAFVECEAARQTVLQYPQTILPGLEDQLREAEEGFRKGQVDLLTFLELDSSAAETYDRALDAQAELAAALAGLLTATQDRDAAASLGSY
ncbi:MAG: TolC family protein [Elusimicrobia bacterium]|nr:TolC family protein [Elusimicrobiota bacterium]